MRKFLASAVVGFISIFLMGPSALLAKPQAGENQDSLSPKGLVLEKQYAAQLDQLRNELITALPKEVSATAETLKQFLSNETLDNKLVKFVVLAQATPQSLAAFAQQGNKQQILHNVPFKLLETAV